MAVDFMGQHGNQVGHFNQDPESLQVLHYRKLTPAEQRYASLEREALAIKELRFYLTGRGGVPKTLME
ncbi:hypothetical protein MHYP_G00362410 [Metynnis hypsauchen]